LNGCLGFSVSAPWLAHRCCCTSARPASAARQNRRFPMWSEHPQPATPRVIHGHWVGKTQYSNRPAPHREIKPPLRSGGSYETALTQRTTPWIIAPYDISLRPATRPISPPAYPGKRTPACCWASRMSYGSIFASRSGPNVFNYKKVPTKPRPVPRTAAAGQVPSCAEGGVVGFCPAQSA